MRSITNQKQLEGRIVAWLEGYDPTPCGVIAAALCENAYEVRNALHALVATGELHTFNRPNGTEMYVVPTGDPGRAA